MDKQYNQRFKLIIIGDSGVGKSSLLLRYCNNEFNKNFITTIGIDFKVKVVNVGDKIIKLQIWDTAGQERFRTITKTYYRGADAVLLVYDITDKISFNHVTNWLSFIKDNADEDIPVFLIANKSDLEHKRSVSTDDVATLARDNNLQLYETSAFNSTGIDELFDHIVNKLCNIHCKVKDNNVVSVDEVAPKQCCH